jgi:hypothetical protein
MWTEVRPSLASQLLQELREPIRLMQDMLGDLRVD